MKWTITAVFDGEVLRPDSLLHLQPNTRYIVTVESEADSDDNDDAWDLLERMAGTVEAPSDWSVEHDHYLYGTPKRNQDSDS